MQKENNSVMDTKELIITRTFDAPKELVFKALTEKEHLSHWWGPKGFQLNVHKLEVKPGGIFHYSIESEGMKMYGIFVYKEIQSPDKIVFINSFADEKGNITRAPFSETWPLEIMNVWTLSEENGKTTLTLRGGPYNATAEEQSTFENMFASMNEGFGGTFDQLDAYLAELKK